MKIVVENNDKELHKTLKLLPIVDRETLADALAKLLKRDYTRIEKLEIRSR